MSCLIITPEIRELAKKFPNETEQSVLNLVSLWQEKNNKSIEDIPLGSELNNFIRELRSPKGKVKTVFSTSGNNSYPSRTRENANWSDITIALAQDFNTAGEKLTKKAAGNKYVSSVLAAESNDASEIAGNLYNQIKTKGKTDNLKINIAGNGIYSMKQSQSYYNDLMTQILMKLQDKGVTISEIRSGGQTGIDEAGIIAAQRLGIPNEVHSTANFMFRDKSGKDISDEQAFKDRFLSSIAQFTLEDFEVKVPDGREVSGGTIGIANGKYVSFHTIEGAFQAAKLNYLDNVNYTEEEFKKLTEEGKDSNTILKKLGEARTTQEVTNIVNEVQLDKGLNTELWNKAAPIIRKALEDKYGKSLSPQGNNQQSKGESEDFSYLGETPSSSFDTPRITSVEEQQKVDLLFDPRTRRDRVTLIARFFSNEVDNALQEITDSLKRRIDDASGVEEEELQAELNSLDRFSAIKKYTPAGIFKRVANIFNSYVQDTEEGRIQQELNAINSMRGADKFSDEQKLEAAKKKAAYKNQEYKKIVDDPSVYKALAEEASTLLVMTEGIRIDPNYIAPADANLNDDDPEGNSEVDNEAEDWRQEEAYKDGWMTNFRQVSSHESLSQAVRKVLRQVPKLDYRGKYEKDDLGFTRYLDADYVHATFIDKLRNMINSDDMLPLMQDLQRIKPWVKQVTKLLQGDETLFSQFYQDFRKDFIPYWIQKKKMMPDGSFKMETIAINKPEGVYYLLDAWRDNYENGVQLDDDSVYEKNGEINKDNAAKGLQWTETLNNMFQNIDTESRLQL